MSQSPFTVDLTQARVDLANSHHARTPEPAATNPHYKPGRLRTVDPITLHHIDIPQRQWLVRDWIPRGSVTMLGGGGGVGKTLLAHALMTACATGKQWIGMDVMPCRALGIFCEDSDDELHRRQNAINQNMGLKFTDLENLCWYSGVGHDNALHVFMRDEWAWEPSQFFQQVHDLASNGGYQLIVLDSLHDLFAGNENSRPEVRRFVQMLHSLALDIDGTVVLSAHPSKAGRADGSGESGSTAWNNSVRSRLYLPRSSDRNKDRYKNGPDGRNDTQGRASDGACDPTSDSEDLRDLERMKSNYAQRGGAVRLRWKDGAFVVNEPEMTGAVAVIQRTNCDAVFMRLLDEFQSENRPVSESSRASNYAPALFSRRPRMDREDFRKRDFHRAMEALFASDQIALESYGPPSRSRRQIIRRPRPLHQDPNL